MDGLGEHVLDWVVCGIQLEKVKLESIVHMRRDGENIILENCICYHSIPETEGNKRKVARTRSC